MKRHGSNFLKRVFTIGLIAGMLFSMVPPGTAVAEEVKRPDGYPAKTIEFIVPAGAGAVLDLYTRAFNAELDLGKPLAIRNIAGGSQTIGLMELAGKRADGHSIGICAFAGIVIQPLLVNVTYDMDSFRPVALTSGPNQYTVCARTGSDITDYESLIEAIKTRKVMHWTSHNAGSPAHLAGLYYLKTLDANNCEYVSYNGTAEALTALISGDVDFLITDDSIVATREADGQVAGLLTLSDRRSTFLAHVPAVEEFGVKGMGAFDAFSWVVVPAKTPDNIYAYIKQEIDKAVTSASYQEFLKKNNIVEMRVYSEQEMKDMIASAREAISAVIELLSE